MINFLLIIKCLVVEGKSVLPTYFPYLEDSHGGQIMCHEWLLNAHIMCPVQGSAHIANYLSIVAHSDLVRQPYSQTLSYHCFLIIMFHVMSMILFQCTISAHCNSLMLILPLCTSYLLLTTCYTMLPPTIVHSFFHVHGGGRSVFD